MTESESRYEEIAKLAIEYAHDFFVRQSTVRRFAVVLAKKMAEYLGCTRDRVTYDRDALSELNCDVDGLWYFAIEVTFKDDERPGLWLNQAFRFGVQPDRERIILRWGAKDSAFDPDLRDSDFSAFFDAFFAGLHGDYETALRSPSGSGRIAGFSAASAHRAPTTNDDPDVRA